MLRVTDSVCDAIRPAVPQPTERQRIGNQIKAAAIPENSTRSSAVLLKRKARASLSSDRPRSAYENYSSIYELSSPEAAPRSV
jgi:hypothetical protein